MAYSDAKFKKYFPDYSPIVLGEKNDEGQLCCYPPEEVATIMRRLERSRVVTIGGKRHASIVAEQISSEDLTILNRFAAHVAGVEECKIISTDGCASCYLGSFGFEHDWDRWGTKVTITCGVQCWYCCIG